MKWARAFARLWTPFGRNGAPMNLPRSFAGVGALCAFVGAALLYTRVPVHGFDLRGAPVLIKRPAADITDVYLFPSPSNTNNVVAVMDVYPAIPAGAGSNTFFDQGVLYTMKFDDRYGSEATTGGGRPIEDTVLQFSFGAASGGSQQVFVYGPGAPNQTGATTTLLNGGNFAGTGFVNKSFSFGTGAQALSVFAGARQDPQFFALTAFYNIFPDRNAGSTAPSCLSGGSNTCPQGFPSPGVDYFGNTNVLSIVVEFPKTLIAGNGNGIVAYWATTSTSTGQ